MDQIYMSSYLTISADTSPDTRSGFLHDRNMLGYTTCVVPTLLTPWTGPTPGSNYGNDSSYASLDKSNLTGRPVPQVARAVCCGVAPAKVSMDSSILSDRGWILQERILSRKLLHWNEFEVSWECNECVASERLPSGDGDGGQTWGWAGKETYNTPWNEFRKILYPKPNGPESWEPTGMKADDWHSLVGEFTRRNLTYVSDRLPAISGLSIAFAKAALRSPSNYYFGLWKESLAEDLCWYRSKLQSSDLRERKEVANRSDVPSFSWGSVDGPVEFIYPFTLDEAIENVEIRSTSDGHMEPSNIVLDGAIFQARLLATERPVHPYGDLKEGMKDAMIWDAPLGPGAAHPPDNIVCLCFGLVERIDNVPVERKWHGLIGLLLEPVEEETSTDLPTFRRIGLYDGLRPEPNAQETNRRTVRII
jgi:hypothetical protein